MITVTEYEKIIEKNKKIAKETKVKCIDCSCQLGSVIETDTQSGPLLLRDKKHVFKCPCGGESFTVKTTNDCYFLSDDKFQVTSINSETPTKFVYTLGRYDGSDNIHNAQ